jgi:hypothetical protein
LNTTTQQTVSTKGQTIVIQPAATDVVYVPQYDPWLVYGAPLAVFPGWYPFPGLFLRGPGIAFGLGFGFPLHAGFGWGWHDWGFDWRHGGHVVYNHNTYISHSTTIVNRNNYQNRNNYHLSRNNFNHFGHGSVAPHAPAGTHSGAFGGFGHGGIARGNGFRGQSSFGGLHGGGGGFHGGGGGGFHGGGGSHGGGGGRR